MPVSPSLYFSLITTNNIGLTQSIHLYFVSSAVLLAAGRRKSRRSNGFLKKRAEQAFCLILICTFWHFQRNRGLTNIMVIGQRNGIKQL